MDSQLAPIEYGCHVTNISSFEPCPSYQILNWKLATDPFFDGPLSCYPLTFFTTTLGYYSKGLLGLPETSIYPCNAPTGTYHWRCKIPMSHFAKDWAMFEVLPTRGAHDFLLLVKSNQAAKFQNKPLHFRPIPDFIHRSLELREDVWYSTIYRSKEEKDRYCKVAVLGAIPLPICVRVPEALLNEASSLVTPALLERAVAPGWKQGWTNKDHNYRVELVRQRFEFLKRNCCTSWRCSEGRVGDPNQLAKEIILLVWKYSEWFLVDNQQTRSFYWTHFIPMLIRIVHSHATHAILPCNCSCDHWDVVRKLPGNYRTVLDGDAFVEAILDKYK